MNKIKFYFLIFLFALFFESKAIGKDYYLLEGKKLFNEKKFSESKFKFEQDIVFNPKSEEAYLYLAKIFKKEEDNFEEEKNINTTLLLEPKNEEAMYLLIDMELNRSNFSEVEKLKSDFKSICSLFCDKLPLIESRLKDFEKKDAS